MQIRSSQHEAWRMNGTWKNFWLCQNAAAAVTNVKGSFNMISVRAVCICETVEVSWIPSGAGRLFWFSLASEVGCSREQTFLVTFFEVALVVVSYKGFHFPYSHFAWLSASPPFSPSLRMWASAFSLQFAWLRLLLLILGSLFWSQRENPWLTFRSRPCSDSAPDPTALPSCHKHGTSKSQLKVSRRNLLQQLI